MNVHAVKLDAVNRLFFFQAEDGIRDVAVTGVQTRALPIFGGVAERKHAFLGEELGAHPESELVCVRADVGWTMRTACYLSAGDPGRVVYVLGNVPVRQIGRASCRERG